MGRRQASRGDEVVGTSHHFLLMALVFAVVASALGVVYSRFESRALFVELQSLYKARDALAVEWDRLQLEEGTLAGHGIIERKARERLDMELPAFDDVEHVQP